MRELFDELDLNHDGYLDQMELQAGLQKHPELAGKREGRDTPLLPSVSPSQPPPAVKPNKAGTMQPAPASGGRRVGRSGATRR